MRSSCLNSRVALLASVAGLLALGLVDWYGDYKEGVEALGSARFSRAVELLQRAARARPEEGKVRSGMFEVEYYPYYHLGKAYVGLGQTQMAREMFTGTRHPEGPRELQLLGPAPSSSTTVPPDGLRELRQGLELLMRRDYHGARPFLERAARFEASRDPAETALADARRLEQSDRALSEAKMLAIQRRYQQALVKFHDALRLDPANEEAKRERDRLTSIVETVTSTVLPTTSVRPPRLAAALVKEAEALLAQRNIAGAVERLGRAKALDPQDPEVVTFGAKLADAARSKARDAAAFLMQARAKEAIPELEDSVTALADSAGVHLLVGWGYYAQYLLEGKEDSPLADRAYERVRRALEIDPGLKPDPLVSPRLIALVHRVRRDMERELASGKPR